LHRYESRLQLGITCIHGQRDAMEVVRCPGIRTSQAASGEACWLGSKMMIISREHQSKKPVNLRPCSDHRYVHPRTAQCCERRHLASWYGNAVYLAFLIMCVVLMYTHGHTPTTGQQRMHQTENRGEVWRRFTRESTPRTSALCGSNPSQTLGTHPLCHNGPRAVLHLWLSTSIFVANMEAHV
jgi:hypothetical protein